jgi:KDO2-lipid IV(A) lauroyltransferase
VDATGSLRERRRRLLEASFANTARSVAEVAYLSRLGHEDLAEMVRYEGLEHLESALARGGGVIGLSAHFGNFELLAVAMAMRGLPLAIVHRERRPALESHVRGWRERGETEVLSRGSAARSALRALRSGRAVAMLMDQDTPREEGVFAPFFSLLACTRDAPVRIALRTGAPVVPLFIFREGTSDRHVVRCQPPLELVPEGESREAAIRENVRRVNGVIEAAIRRSPEMWTWNHRRWRTQPPGEPRPYPPRRRERRKVL